MSYFRGIIEINSMYLMLQYCTFKCMYVGILDRALQMQWLMPYFLGEKTTMFSSSFSCLTLSYNLMKISLSKYFILGMLDILKQKT